MVNFDEQDLLRFAEATGFEDITMDYRVHRPRCGRDQLGALVNVAPNPQVPTLQEILDRALAREDQARLRAPIEDQIAAGRRRQRLATVYLTATR